VGRRDGAVDRVGATGSFLGMLEDVHLVDVTDPLRSGDVLVLYTDGVTEARHQGGAFLDDEGLEALVGDAPADLSAQELANLVVEHALAFQEGVPRDDIAVVVLRAP
jgi:sigma-B regulation protein RsbU (phosphoserine phosphatase)